MALGIKQIRDLVAKWENDAIAENENMFNILHEQQVDQYFAENMDFYKLVNDTQEALDKTIKGINILYEIVGTDIFIGYRNIEKEVFREDSYSARQKFRFVAEIYAGRHQKNYEIRTEYKKLNERITGCKTAKKAKQMLADMGLDVSSLEETSNPPVAVEDTPLNLVLMGLKKVD